MDVMEFLLKLLQGGLGNLAGVVFGVFMYFPTLVEVPIAKTFHSLGMHRGPLLASLMVDPELSLLNILITASIIGRLKAWIYGFWMALFSTPVGLIYGSRVNGNNIEPDRALPGCVPGNSCKCFMVDPLAKQGTGCFSRSIYRLVFDRLDA